MSELINKQCPICGEYIPVNSMVCEFCGEEFKESAPIEEKSEEFNSEANNDIIENEESSSIEQTDEMVSSDDKSVQSRDDDINSEKEEQCDEIQDDEPKNSKLKQWILIVIFFIIGMVSVFLILSITHKGIDVTIAPKEKIKTKTSKAKILLNVNSAKIEKAKALYKNKQFNEAAEIFQEEIDSSENPIAYYYMGEIYKLQGFNKIAIQNYQKALENKKNFFEPLKRLAEVYVTRGENELALEYANRAFKQKSNDIELLKTFVQIYQDTEEEDKLIPIYKKIVSLDKKDYDSNHYLAYYYYNQDEFKDAVPYFNNLLNSEYDTSIAYALATCYSRIEYYSKAIEILNLIIKKDPSEYYGANYAKNRLSEMKEYYKYSHSKPTKPNKSPSDENYDEDAENDLF